MKNSALTNSSGTCGPKVVHLDENRCLVSIHSEQERKVKNPTASLLPLLYHNEGQERPSTVLHFYRKEILYRGWKGTSVTSFRVAMKAGDYSCGRHC